MLLVRFVMVLVLAESVAHAGVEDAVVQIGDCSGVCVDPTGLVLTAKHCDPPPVALVRFRDRTVLARRVFLAAETEGPVVFDCEGEGFPCAPLADAVPPVGANVRSCGYVRGGSSRQLRWASGSLIGGATFEFRGGTFRGNLAGFVTGPGWSGGPLLNANGEVCGLLNSSSCATSVFISFKAVRQANQAARDQLSSKPTLYVFGSTNCGPCVAFKQDYAENAALNQKLTAQFTVVFVDIDVHRDVVQHFAIEEIPAFVVSGQPPITGYVNADALLAKLGVNDEEAVAKQPTNNESTKVQQPAVENPATTPPVTADGDRLQALHERLDSVVGVASTALTLVQWLGIAGATGGIGGLVLGGIAFARSLARHRRESRTARDPPAPPAVVTIDSPPPPQAIVPETKFAPYERDTFAEAFAWAEAEIARKYPGSVGTLETLHGLISQYLAAKGLKPAK